jgi:hypothetical protein
MKIGRRAYNLVASKVLETASAPVIEKFDEELLRLRLRSQEVLRRKRLGGRQA